MIHIVYYRQASSLESTACIDLKSDLEEVSNISIQMQLAEKETIGEILKKINPADQLIIVGTPASNPIIAEWSQQGLLNLTASNPGKRGGGIFNLLNTPLGNQIKVPCIVLGGSDAQGAQYTVYDFCKIDLEIDTFRYWTGVSPIKKPNFTLSNVKTRLISPPLVPILGYFDNDNDELANLTEPFLEFSWEQWQELIKTLVRLKYNAIDIHDHLGRAEFYRWPFYRNLRPNYSPNIDLLNRLIDYAHERGVMIQVSYYLGWAFKFITDEASLDWFKHKQEWLDVWNYYLKETPIGKCDIFLNRPRDQRWDRKFMGKGKNNPVSVFNEAFPAMYALIKEHNPNAIVIVDLYSEGRKVFQDGFRPEPKSGYILAWPDNGFGKFEYLPKDSYGYNFGIYMHAGFFRNHVVMDPYPEVLENAMKTAFDQYQMTHYCLVNGQTVRHFILNLEVCSALCDNPALFNAAEFYTKWSQRYFQREFAADIIKIFQIMHQVQEGKLGYIDLMYILKFSSIRARIKIRWKWGPWKLINKVIDKNWKIGSSLTQKLENNVQSLRESMTLCKDIRSKLTKNLEFFYDFIELPVNLLLTLNQIALSLQKVASESDIKTHYTNAIDAVQQHHQLRVKGDQNPKWQGWYNPDHRRPNGGYFDMDLLNREKRIEIHKNK